MKVAVGDVDLDVDHTGPSDGPVLIWGHGLTSSKAGEERGGLIDWSSAAPGWHVVRYDARGHGKSGGTSEPDDYRWPALASDLFAVLDAAGAARAVVGGASMGAATALHAAVAAPERVEALVLVIPPTAWETRAAQGRIYRAGAVSAQLLGPSGVARMAKLAPPPEILRDELSTVTDAATASMAKMKRAVLPAVLRGAAASDLPPPESVASLTMPALILAWDTDTGHPVATAERLGELLPGATVHIARQPSEVRAWPAHIAAFLHQLGS